MLKYAKTHTINPITASMARRYRTNLMRWFIAAPQRREGLAGAVDPLLGPGLIFEAGSLFGKCPQGGFQGFVLAPIGAQGGVHHLHGAHMAGGSFPALGGDQE